MAEHDASRTTVREALTLLSEEGLVRRLQGQGTFVLDLPALVSLREYHGVGDPQPASLLGGAIRSHVLDEQVVPAPRDLASMLECPLGSPTLRVDYVAVVGDERIVVATNYVRMPEGQAVAAVPFRTDWYVRLADAGVAVGETDMLIEAGLADEFDADLLGIRPGEPIMIMEQIIRGDTGAPFNLAVLRSAGRKLSLLSRHRRSDRE
jgi:GntR family transcriptional regulator